MKTKVMRGGRWRLGLAVCLVAAFGAVALQCAPPRPQSIETELPVTTELLDHRTEPRFEIACSGQLRRIHEALSWYREENQDRFPGTLSELMGLYLTDGTLLKCPYVEETGRIGEGREGLRDEVWADLQSGYAYEFSRAEQHLPGNVRITLIEYKMRQVEFLNSRGLNGGVVPVVRCLAHRPVLNLSLDGVVYQSPIHWEDIDEIQNAGVDHVQLSQGALFAERIQEGQKALGYPMRDPACGPEHVDLTKHYNGMLTKFWQTGLGAIAGNDLAMLPRGLQEFGGRRYDVRGLIQLSSGMMPEVFPGDVTNIVVDQTCRAIHFLQATAFPDIQGTRIGHYLVRYGDGVEIEIPILYGRDAQDWWFEPPTDGSASAPAGETATVAWTGENTAARAQGKIIRLYHSRWENPRPEVPIYTMDFVSAGSLAAPFLVAVTLE
jgi:hypothetical protein